jgi:ribosomal protein S18 acetylase RimI-like enzyme
VSRGKTLDAATLPGFLAVHEQEVVGLITLHVDSQSCEVVTLDAFKEGMGVGSELLKEAERYARTYGCSRLWLITSNDNIEALAFYQRRGFRIVAVHPDAITEARKIKPQIPLVAENGIDIRDEVELSKPLV